MRPIRTSNTSRPIVGCRGIAAAAMLASLAACGRAPKTDPRMVSELMHTMYGVIRAERLSPPVASRLMAYSTVALYSGLASVDSRLRSVAGTFDGLSTLPQREARGTYD